MNGNAELTHLLLDAGADPKAETDDGRTPATLAAASGDAETIGLIEAALR
jgi:ankyrin repeat protein